MTDEEIKAWVAEWGFNGEEAERATRLCQEVKRRVTHHYFAFMQHANNAACEGKVSARELDIFLFNAAKPVP